MTVSHWLLLQKDWPRVVIGPNCLLWWLKKRSEKLAASPSKIDVTLFWEGKGLSALWRRKERLSCPSGPSFIPKTIVLTANLEPAAALKPTGSRKCHCLQRLSKEINTTGSLLTCNYKPVLVLGSFQPVCLFLCWIPREKLLPITKLPESPSNTFYLHRLCWQNRWVRLFGQPCASQTAA